jgi:hypothetical protein
MTTGVMSDYLEKKIQDHVLGATVFTTPATVYMGLWTATLDDTSTGATAGEVSGGSYARVSITNNTTNWPNASGITALKQNGVAINFATPSAGWGTVTYWALVDSSSGAGNILYFGALTNSKTINTSDTVSFAINALQITAD